MLNKLYPFLLLMLLITISCGGDDEEQEEMENTECAGDISITLDGEAQTFGTPLSATFADVAFNTSTELLVAWMEGSRSINVQVVINGGSLDCMPTGRYNLKDLPANVSLLSFQYFDFNGKNGTVSNIFIEDGGDGWVDIQSCDGANDQISLDFEFDGVDSDGSIIQVRGGSASDICFARTK